MKKKSLSGHKKRISNKNYPAHYWREHKEDLMKRMLEQNPDLEENSARRSKIKTKEHLEKKLEKDLRKRFLDDVHQMEQDDHLTARKAVEKTINTTAFKTQEESFSDEAHKIAMGKSRNKRREEAMDEEERARAREKDKDRRRQLRNFFKDEHGKYSKASTWTKPVYMDTVNLFGQKYAKYVYYNKKGQSLYLYVPNSPKGGVAQPFLSEKDYN